MFIKISILKNLLKNAYKGAGLMVHNTGNIDNAIYIQGQNWLMAFFGGNIPKEIKGELIKLIGDLPQKGEAFRITEDGNQMAIDLIDSTPFGIPDAEWNITKVLYEMGGTYRVIENARTKEKKMILATYTEMIDLKLLDKDELAPEGPYVPKGAPNCIAWETDEILYAAYITDTNSNAALREFLDALKNVNCSS